MVTKVTVKRRAGTPFEREVDTTFEDVLKDIGSACEWIPATSLTLTDKHQGLCLVFTNACTVTIPSGLRPNFSCGFVQAGSGVVSFAAAGVVMNAFEGRTKSAGPWSSGALCAIDAEIYLLYGQLVT